MNAFFNRLTSGWNIAAIFLGISAWGSYLVASVTGTGAMWALIALDLVVIAGLMMRWQWARSLGIVLLLWLVVGRFYRMATGDFNWGRLGYAATFAFAAYGLWKKPNNGIIDDLTDEDASAGKEGSAEDSKPIISLVHLRSQQRYLEAPVLANALSEAWGLNIVGGEADDANAADGFVAGRNPIFIVMVTQPSRAMFLVHNHDRTYFDEPEEVAANVPNLRFAQIIRDHAAWLAVDLMEAMDTKVAQDDAYRLIGKAISALADDDVMAIMCPQHHFFNLWSSELETLLCGDAPLDALREEVKAPVYGIPDGEVIENAIAEARLRWPEFVAVFKSRQPDDDRFIVKAPFKGEDGQVEHMWLHVFGLEPEYVHGHLVNHPMHTTKLKQGSQVEVPVAEVSDWVCPDPDGNPMGNFTQQAIAEATRTEHKA
jgi:uncharacterized protein YegJ (DUF2314 family)